ncbi:MAG: sugar ABC transporter ATP-binding protein [Lachnospiraceae bacterium]|nr:sugar ABC transporter ATP-binding protein [Lachnospiraceae bacterium]
MKKPILEMKQITKYFGTTVALKNVDFTVYPGEVRGLIGENGSGKSTISSIAAGMQKASAGEMFFHGKPWNPESMIDALSHGIGMIVQESGTIQGITVAENLFLGETKQFQGRFGLVDRKKMNAAADEALDFVGISNVRGAMPMASIDFQTRKLVEIAKVVMKKPDILVVDETTTALSQDGRKILYDVVKQFQENGKSVIFISHDLDEVMEVCSELTVLRDGVMVATLSKKDFDADVVKQFMVGRELQGDYYRTDFGTLVSEEVALELKDGCAADLDHLNVTLHKGEILGVGGLSHCGMHTLGKVLFGAQPLSQGQVMANGVQVSSESTAMSLGIGYVSKDRDTESLNLNASIGDNIAIAGLDRFAVSRFLILSGKEREYVNKQIEDLSIKCFDGMQEVNQLSGGNKQKVVFGKWVGRDSDILILDCPTRGVDIGVKQFMYQMMYRMRMEGKSILLISEELSELIGMSDRIIIMKDGAISGEFERSRGLTDSMVIDYMI